MKKVSEILDPYRMLALVIISILLIFVGIIFVHQSRDKSDLQKAGILEVLELEDDQGLVNQNFLVSLDGQETRIQVQIPLNLPEVKSLKKGDIIYLQQTGDENMGMQYRYASTDQTLEFLLILIGFGAFLFIVLGLKPLHNMFPTFFFLVFLASGVFNVSGEIRVVFLSLIGLMGIVSLVHVLWLHRDVFLGMITSTIILFTIFFVTLFHILLVNLTNISETVHFQQLFSKDLLIYDFSQAKLLVIMIVTFGLLSNLIVNLINSFKEYLKGKKNPTQYGLIKFNLSKVQDELGKLLNIIFFIALGLNFLGMVGEDFATYNYVWNNSFFLSVVIDAVVTASALVVGGYIAGLLLAIYYDWKISRK